MTMTSTTPPATLAIPPVDASEASQREARLRLPEQELCLDCAADEHAEPGVPQEVVDHGIEIWSAWGDNPADESDVEIWLLACGHTLCRPR